MKFRSLFLLTVAFSVNALAQTATPASAPGPTSAPVAADASVAKHNCTKPALPDGSIKITEARMKVFVAGLDGYKDCVTAFAAVQQKSALAQQQAAQASIGAGNAAIKEYNDFVEEANKVTGQKDGTEKPFESKPSEKPGQ